MSVIRVISRWITSENGSRNSCQTIASSSCRKILRIQEFVDICPDIPSANTDITFILLNEPCLVQSEKINVTLFSAFDAL